jgi:membrane protease YdiL (CAAX protease family)
LGWLFQQPPLNTFKSGLIGLSLGVAATLPILAGLALVIGMPVAPFQRLQRVFEEFGRPFFASYTVIDLAILALLAGMGEELLFRGVLQAILDRWWEPWIGLLIASALFGALHALTPTYAALATLAGIYLGGVWLLTGNLLVVIIAHGLYDFIALVYLLRFKAAS